MGKSLPGFLCVGIVRVGGVCGGGDNQGSVRGDFEFALSPGKRRCGYAVA